MYLLRLFGAKALVNYLIYPIVVLFQKRPVGRVISVLWIIKQSVIMEATASKNLHIFPSSPPCLRNPVQEWGGNQSLHIRDCYLSNMPLRIQVSNAIKVIIFLS